MKIKEVYDYDYVNVNNMNFKEDPLNIKDYIQKRLENTEMSS